MKDSDRFLDFLLDSAREPEVPPFFAARVANIAFASEPPLLWSIDFWARRLIPLLGSLALVFWLVSFQGLNRSDLATYPGLVLEQESSIAPETTEDLLDFLVVLESEGSFDNPR